jgi:hypothetical protein
VIIPRVTRRPDAPQGRRRAGPRPAAGPGGARTVIRRALPALGPAPGTVNDEVLDLQRNAGNRAVTTLIQRQDDRTGLPLDRNGIPKQGPDVRTALRERYPALLGALTGEQLDQWQKVVDYYTIRWDVERKLDRLWGEFARFEDVRVRAQVPEYKAKRSRLEKAVPPKPDENLTVDVRLLLADDVHQEPEWDVKAELTFRQWAVEQVTKEPLKLDIRPRPDEVLSQHPMPGIVNKTKGFITAQDLRNEYRREYDAWVIQREELVKLRQALSETNQVVLDVRPEHVERSQINARRPGFGLVRHISEALGTGDADYPSIRMWDQPQELIKQAWPLLNERKYELAVPLIAMAEQSTAQCAQRYLDYEKRVTTGALTAIKWLGRVKAAGAIAAGIASGGLGLTGSALVAGGYTLAQEGAGRAAEMYYGQRKEFGAASLIQAAGVSALMTLLGGALQARFQVAIKARIDQMPNLAGTKLAELTSSALAAGTSSVYITATELAIKAVVDGKSLPKDARALANLVIDNAIENIAMDVGLAGVNSRVGREYAAWREGKGKPAVTVPDAPVADPTKPVTVPTADQTPGRLPEQAVRSLLTEAGGWDRLHHELQSGTGLGSNMALSERQALITRFEAHREALAQNVSSVFGGDVVVVHSPAGRQIEVRFPGPDGPQHVEQAKEYLDAKSPGWAEKTSVRLTAEPMSTGTGKRSVDVAVHLTPEARVLVDEFAPIYERWQALKTPEARFEALLAVVNKPLVAAGAPPLLPSFLKNPKTGDLGKLGLNPDPNEKVQFPVWELHVNRALLELPNPTARQFADAADTFAHEARHALQYFRMARLHVEANLRPGETLEALRQRLPDDKLLNQLDPMVLKAAMQANAGTRSAETFKAGELKHQEAKTFYDSVYGAGSDKRSKIYEDMDVFLKERDVAFRRARLMLELDIPLNDPRFVDADARYNEAKARYDRVHREYELLVEEIDARYHGQDVGRGVTQRVAELATVRALERARARHREAYNEYRKTETAALVSQSRLSVQKRLDDREAAFRRFEAAANIVKKLAARLEAAAAKKAKQP